MKTLFLKNLKSTPNIKDNLIGGQMTTMLVDQNSICIINQSKENMGIDYSNHLFIYLFIFGFQ